MKTGMIYTMDDGAIGQFLCLSIFPDKQWAYMVQVAHSFPEGYEGSVFDVGEWSSVNLDIMPELTRGESEFPIALIGTAGWVVLADHQWHELTLGAAYSEMGIWKLLARLLKNKQLKPYEVGG